jgi:HEAT repeat protein
MGSIENWIWPMLLLAAVSPAAALPDPPASATATPAAPGGPAAPADETYQVDKADREQEKLDREDQLYETATGALDEGQWDRAIESFDRVASAGGRRADAALYWKAYALNKSGQRPPALAALEALRKAYPQSRWLKEAQALELEVRQGTGQAPPPESQPDEDLKLMALNSLLATDAERAVPMLEKLLAGNPSPRLRERALFVLCQTGSPKAREIVVRIARGQSNLELQRKAIQFLGLFGGPESRQVLSEIYASTPDTHIKRTILRGFMVAGDKERLVTAARSEASPELRREAIRQLGVMGAQAELWELYRAEGAAEAKKEILRAFSVGGGSDKLMEVARSEKDPGLKREAIQGLGIMGREKTGEFLASLYASDKDPEVRRHVLRSIFVQGNAKSLVEIARAEKDLAMKKEVVSLLSHMDSPEATKYLLEILNQ